MDLQHHHALKGIGVRRPDLPCMYRGSPRRWILVRGLLIDYNRLYEKTDRKHGGDATMTIKRGPESYPGRTRTVQHNGLTYVVVSAPDKTDTMAGQTQQCLDWIDEFLAEIVFQDAGAERRHLGGVRGVQKSVGEAVAAAQSLLKRAPRATALSTAGMRARQHHMNEMQHAALSLRMCQP